MRRFILRLMIFSDQENSEHGFIMSLIFFQLSLSGKLDKTDCSVTMLSIAYVLTLKKIIWREEVNEFEQNIAMKFR